MSIQKPTAYLLFSCLVIVQGSFQMGYHTGELNIPQKVIMCQNANATTAEPRPDSIPRYFVPCLPMSSTEFSLATSILNIGGLIGSLTAPRFADTKGRRWTILANTIILGIGSLIMSFSNTTMGLVTGRLLVGIGSGVVTVVVPPYLAEIAPKEDRGMFGVANQLGIVLGILFAQVEGLYFSTPNGWRIILLTGFAIALIQGVLLVFVDESPKYLATKPGGYSEAKRVLQRLRGTMNVEDELNSWRQATTDDGLQGLMEDSGYNAHDVEHPTSIFHTPESQDGEIGIQTFLTSPAYRSALIVVLIVQLAQPLSGINAVIFYSTAILSKILPNFGDVVTVFINVVNLIMTVMAAIFIDRVGRRFLLLVSMGSMAIVSAMLGLGITQNLGGLSAFGTIAFVAAFAIGLGPIPFLITPEVVDTYATATAQGFGLILNWLCNFLVGFVFLGLSDAIGGNVFYLFTAILVAAFLATRRYVPETRGKSVEEVWREWSAS